MVTQEKSVQNKPFGCNCGLGNGGVVSKRRLEKSPLISLWIK